MASTTVMILLALLQREPPSPPHRSLYWGKENEYSNISRTVCWQWYLVHSRSAEHEMVHKVLVISPVPGEWNKEKEWNKERTEHLYWFFSLVLNTLSPLNSPVFWLQKPDKSYSSLTVGLPQINQGVTPNVAAVPKWYLCWSRLVWFLVHGMQPLIRMWDPQQYLLTVWPQG